MSMPHFPDANTIPTREEAINAILTSIAMEETALSHILNAEGEKLQYAIRHVSSCDCCMGVQKMLEVNESVALMIEQVSDMQIILKNKMRLAASFLPYESENPGKPDKPDKPDRPDKPDVPCPPKSDPFKKQYYSSPH